MLLGFVAHLWIAVLVAVTKIVELDLVYVVKNKSPHLLNLVVPVAAMVIVSLWSLMSD